MLMREPTKKKRQKILIFAWRWAVGAYVSEEARMMEKKSRIVDLA